MPMAGGSPLHRSTAAIALAGVAFAGAAMLAVQSRADAQARAGAAAPFTAGQADAGKAAYDRYCAACHGTRLEGAGPAVALQGDAFRAKWRDKSLADLLSAVERMPPGQADQVSAADRLALLAFLLRSNGAAAGDQPLPTERDKLATLPVIRSAAAASAPKPVVIAPVKGASRLDAVTPVTAADLARPPAADWLTWRGTFDAAGDSPLKQITRANVGRLSLAWAWSLPPGGNMMTPIVRDGVIYTYSFGDIVEALDGTNGALLWRFQRTLADGVFPQGKKGVAIAGDAILVPTSDMHMIALDARTGRVLWDHTIDTGAERKHQIKSAPLIAGNNVIIGVNGFGEVKGGNFIVALDLKTGEEKWRFNTVAHPGEPGGDSWNGLPLNQRSGGSVWVSGSYDPDLDLVYFGAAPTYEGNGLRQPVDGKGVTNQALYTDTTLAIHPDTGKLAWYYQHQGNDQLDHDWVYERTLMTLPIAGKPRRVVVTAGKQAVFDVLDARTGEYLSSMDMGLQNAIVAIDPKTGAKTINPLAQPKRDQRLVRLGVSGICPDLLGARNLMSTSYSPRTRWLYVPLTDTCVDPFPNGRRWQREPDPASDGKWGMFRAIDLSTHKTMWTTRQAPPPVSGALTTGGGLAFLGFVDRSFRAFDERTGRELWSTTLDNAPASYPISYEVGGRQYVAVATNEGFVHVQAMLQVTGIRPPPAAGATLWVFALPAR